jgi:hypothetical protein
MTSDSATIPSTVTDAMREAGEKVLWALADSEGDGPAFKRAASDIYLAMLAASRSTEAPASDDVAARAHEIALKSLYWSTNSSLVYATEKLREDGYNNAAGHLSTHMAGRFLDAYMAARAALKSAALPVEVGTDAWARLGEPLFRRRHELTDAEWLEAAPVLLGLAASLQSKNSRLVEALETSRHCIELGVPSEALPVIDAVLKDASLSNAGDKA